ncbi:MAG: hypothetical protein AAGI14_03675 [Pseudomonadota bacterium]
MLATLFFAVGLFVIFNSDVKPLNLVLFGSGDLSEVPSENAKFAVPAITRLAVGLTFLIGAATLIATKLLLTNVTTDFERDRALFNKNEREISANVERINAEIATKARDNRFDELKAEFNEFKQLRLKGEMYGYSGTSIEKLGEEEYQSTTVGIEDKLGQEKLLVVVHLFKNQAHWKLSSATEFLTADGNDYDLLGLLATADARTQFSKFDLVVGVGLSSNTAQDDKTLAERRANFLCTAIYVSGSVMSPELSAGLIAGKYTGTKVEAKTQLETMQRPLIIVGIDVIDPDADVEVLLNEILNEVRVPGIDLSLYENIEPDQPLPWIKNTKCSPQFGFLRGRTIDETHE